jgi:hypothetical protein
MDCLACIWPNGLADDFSRQSPSASEVPDGHPTADRPKTAADWSVSGEWCSRPQGGLGAIDSLARPGRLLGYATGQIARVLGEPSPAFFATPWVRLAAERTRTLGAGPGR